MINLYVFCHGFVGSENDWNAFKAKLPKKDNTVYYFATSNRYMKSWLGIDICGKNLADEVEIQLDKYKDKTINLSFICHSFGGIYAREAIYLIDKKYNNVIFSEFYTMNSPHLGVCRKKGTLTRYAMDRFAFFAGLTGYELAKCNSRLDELADEKHVSVLAKFKHLVLIGASHYDETVKFSSALISKNNPCKKCNEYRKDIKVVGFECEKKGNCLQSLPWKRYAVDFGVNFNSIFMPVHLYCVGKLRPISFSFIDEVKIGIDKSDLFIDWFVETFLSK